MNLFFILCEASRSETSKMAAHKNRKYRKYSFQPISKVAAEFKQLYPCIQGPGVQWSYSLYCVMQAEIWNPRWWTTNRKELLLSLYTTNIQRLPPRFQCPGFEWRYILYCAMQAEIINLRWRLTNRKCLHLSLYTMLLHNSNGNPHVFKGKEFSGAILYIVWCKISQKSKMAAHEHEFFLFVSRHL